MSNSMLKLSITEACKLLKQGAVLAHPAEGVYGLTCDPFNQTAVEHLCALKHRSLSMGLVIVAGDIEQIAYLIDSTKLDPKVLIEIKKSWPGPHTWIVPATKQVPIWISGTHTGVGLRVSAHPVLKALSLAFKSPIVSTSANIHGQKPVATLEEMQEVFPTLAGCVEGEIGQLGKPTSIRDAASGVVLRI